MIRIENLTKRFANKVILNEQSFQFPIGQKIAVVGDNGAGKTSLLNILCDLDQADGGLILKPSQCTLGYLPQEPNPEPKPTVLEECETADKKVMRLRERMNKALAILEHQNDAKTLEEFEQAETQFRLEGGYDLRSRAEKILLGLGFSTQQTNASPRILSGGWRMRIELAKLFLMNPDVLILDEPTNHLDLPSLVWVERYLQNFEGTLIFVSHDRSLLNRLATMTLHIAWGRLVPYAGNYDFFRRKQAESAAIAEKTLKNLEDKRDSLQVFVDRFGSKATKAAQAQSKRKMIDKIQIEIDSVPIEKDTPSIQFSLPDAPPCDRIVCRVEKGAIGYQEDLCRNIDFTLEKGQKVAIIGANGIGKSTLLKTIVGRINPRGGKFSLSQRAIKAYFSQDQLDYLHADRSALENLLEASPIGERAARSLLGSFLFRGDDVFKKVSVLSGGEKSRVGLACVLAKKANLVLLDEPTNHLDMNSIQCLTEAIKNYNGTVVFVSHDREFIDAICSHVFVMTKDGQAMLFEGNIEDYQRMAAGAGFPDVFQVENESKQVAVAKKTKSTSPNKELERKNKQLRDKAQKIEAEIHALAQKIKGLEQELIDASSDHNKSYELAVRKQELESKIQELEDEWLVVSEGINQG